LALMFVSLIISNPNLLIDQYLVTGRLTKEQHI
jgi:hypothetical protein